jgi:hypothetical protein
LAVCASSAVVLPLGSGVFYYLVGGVIFCVAALLVVVRHFSALVWSYIRKSVCVLVRFRVEYGVVFGLMEAGG